VRLTSASLFVALLATVLAAPCLADGQEEAKEVIDHFHASLLDVMKSGESLGFDGRYAQLEPAIARTVDQEFMARKSLGRAWRSLSEADQARWLDVFTRLSVANYAGRFSGYSGESFETVGTKPAPRDTVLVETKVVLPDQEDVSLNYRMRETPAGWRVVDIYLNGTVSELSLRRSEYSSTVEREGFESLVGALNEKLVDLAGDSGQSATAKVSHEASATP
jgi:phospholipid transport system substrate-binding protein